MIIDLGIHNGLHEFAALDNIFVILGIGKFRAVRELSVDHCCLGLLSEHAAVYHRLVSGQNGCRYSLRVYPLSVGICKHSLIVDTGYDGVLREIELSIHHSALDLVHGMPLAVIVSVINFGSIF